MIECVMHHFWGEREYRIEFCVDCLSHWLGMCPASCLHLQILAILVRVPLLVL